MIIEADSMAIVILPNFHFQRTFLHFKPICGLNSKMTISASALFNIFMALPLLDIINKDNIHLQEKLIMVIANITFQNCYLDSRLADLKLESRFMVAKIIGTKYLEGVRERGICTFICKTNLQDAL